jgi:hypothetical protein
MISWKKISDEDARSAIRDKEFADAILSSREKVAVILTQGWCHQWLALKHGLEHIASSEGPDIDVHVFVYDRSPLFDEFLAFKETVFGNTTIPYVRYYRNGRFQTDSNYVPVQEFLARFD